MIVPTSATRVRRQTPEHVNKAIRHTSEASIAHYARHKDQIDQRLAELDEEWDIERTLEANAATLALTGSVLGLLGTRRWLVLPIGVTASLLQHAIQGWCPPVALFRRLGVRTSREIEAERYALKALRGDFENIASDEKGVDQAIEATGRLR